ncbi:aryl-alcohol dehydrogenase [Agrocybe pediades]|nr:aryl-alcohol dehydrogenase [Agrocybe pediades]
MQFGHPDWQKWVMSQEEATRQVKAAYDAGIQTFDTADSYSNGQSEVILGNAIKQLNLPRDEIVVMTKVFGVVGRDPSTLFWLSGKNPDDYGYVNQHGLSRKHIFDAVQGSLKRLQLDYIDLLQCHRFDPNTPIEETMQALHDVVKAGYVRYVGMSSCYAWQYYAINNKLTPFISMQNHYSLVYREEEREMYRTLKYFGVGSITWSPLARGLLSRPLAEQTKRSTTDFGMPLFANSPGIPDILARVEEVAKKQNISMARVAIAWLLSKEGVSAPIVGPTSVEYLEDIIGAFDVKLTDEEAQYLEEPYKPQGIIGHA